MSDQNKNDLTPFEQKMMMDIQEIGYTVDRIDNHLFVLEFFIIGVVVLFCIIFATMRTKAADFEEPDIYKGHATAYCLHGTTASGQQTRHGICAAKKEWLGKTIILYQRLPDGSYGDLIGIYEVLDTGGTKGLKNGSVVDIWCEDLDECQEFMNKVYENGCKGKVYWQLLEADG